MKKLGFFLATALLVSAPVQAATITFNNITAVWSNGVPAANVSFTGNGTGSASANWGGIGGSGYDFVAAATPFSVDVPPVSGNFSLGTFTHRNQPIPSGSSITSLRLSVTSSIDVNGTSIGDRTFVFDFVHNETTNGNLGDPCPDGGTVGVGVNVNGCADQVTFFFNSLSENFDIGGVAYTLNLNGFIVSGNPVGSFWTQESNNNSAGLQAYVDALANVPVVPEPATFVLLSLGLIGVAAAVRRRRV